MSDTVKPTVYVFIDASNLWAAQKVKGRMFDFQKLKVFLNDKHAAKDTKIFYYTAYPSDGTRDYNLDGRHKFYTYLKKGLGFTVRKKELKRIAIHTDEGDSFEEKGNMDVEMTIDALHHMNKYDIAVLFSGDSDFLALVNYLKQGGKKIYVYSSKNNISEELRTGGDGYTDVLKIANDIWGRELRHREQK
ncbi:MAG: NYN domain-containing protein [bacterium]|nr:NYN domain-containing protein [bacterium]